MVDLRETKDLYNELGGLMGISALKNITVSLDRVVASTSINIVLHSTFYATYIVSLRKTKR